ncbi:ATP-binding protein [Thetidibacter halocola]|uniref:histidine kinase n=1 Tax=Thetidibacter halocola TaxID=2827239 RepID=A0A8J8B7K6_9RHOB|nr:ATP-binding protein [Thetidibacter halocola]MBS0124517.1 response regulator [Thetidibacter halocola]
MQTVIDILDNLVLLGMLGVFHFFVELNRGRLGPLGASLATGLVFGIVGFMVTATPVTLIDGATVDARAGPVILAGLFGGPIAAGIAATLGAIARGLVGGSFAPSGMLVYFLYGLFGIILQRFSVIPRDHVATARSIALLIGGSWIAASAMFLVIRPAERAIQWLNDDLPYILLANALSVGVSVGVVALAAMFLSKTVEAMELGRTLNLAKSAGRFGIWDFDVTSGVLKWDDTSKEMHGIDKEAFRGTYEDWSKTVHVDDLPMVQAAFSAALAEKKPFSVEYRVVLPGGAMRAIKGDAIVLFDRASKPLRVVGTNLDLSELRSAEEKLIEAQSLAAQAQKFETIGQLTGGVAHDFNNLLAVIMGNQELLRDAIRNPPVDVSEANVLIDATIEATKRGADLSRNMLAYARKAQLQPVLTDLNELVRETDSWLRRMIESSVEIETILQAGLWSTRVDRASMQSALVNLVVNARDAMGGAGRVTIETSNIRIDHEYITDRHEEIAAGRYVMLAVSDTGPGIPMERLDHIFDPFFTTKPTGKGSGLGLSMVQGFVKQSRGAIRVYTEIDVGTSFKLYFPAVEEPEATTRRSIPAERPAHEGLSEQRRILLVEDDDRVLAVLTRTLRNAGYEVVQCRNGDDALETFRKDRDFDLVVTDIVMPGQLQGPMMSKEIRNLDPDMRFVFLSGYASEATVHGNGLHPSDIRLMKPVSRNDLLTSVRRAIQGK